MRPKVIRESINSSIRLHFLIKNRRVIRKSRSSEMKYLFALSATALLAGALSASAVSFTPQNSDLALPQEKHLRNVRQLTFGGENAEAYFSSDGRKLIFQSTRDGRGCDQIYTMNVDGSD